jgi:nicotinamidase-related amidase
MCFNDQAHAMKNANINRKQALKRIATSAALLSMTNIDVAAHNTAMTTTKPQPSTMDWKTSALIIVDMQNDFVRAGAPLEVPTAITTVAAQRSLIQTFRKHKLPIIYTKFLSHPHYYLLWEWSPQCKPPTKCCWKGHQRHYKDIDKTQECTDIIDELSPLPNDIIIEKFFYGSFHETTLHKTLRGLGVTSLVMTGTVTQICVEETAREAFHHGYKTTVVEDGVSSFAPDLHAAMLKNFAMKFGWVSKSESVIATIGALK